LLAPLGEPASWPAALPLKSAQSANRCYLDCIAFAPSPTPWRRRPMTDTQQLLGKIAALRQRLAQAQGLVQAARSAATALLHGEDRVQSLEAQAAEGARAQSLLDTALRQLSGTPAAGTDGAALPAQLTSRAARLLRRAQERIGQLRGLTDEPLLSPVDHDPLAQLYRETVSMTDCVLRAVLAFPESPNIQIRLCEGLEAVLCVVAERLATITIALEQRRREATRRQALADVLGAL